MKVGVVVFPGSNCDHDALCAASLAAGHAAKDLWHASTDLDGCDAIVLPGGFSYGDYLRTGAIARFSPILEPLARFAASGGPVLGICNGFQILCEAGLLPGALIRNAGLRYVCRQVRVRVERNDTPFSGAYEPGAVVHFPVAHGEGSYTAPPETLERMERQGQVVFRYLEGDNPNGSLHNVAGICNEARNVVGLMPHPERAIAAELGSGDGWGIFASLAAACR
ncbi:MAG: phosphoribosylformylglycinamidine synthase subunit PurQ [Terriglobales bacterium]